MREYIILFAAPSTRRPISGSRWFTSDTQCEAVAVQCINKLHTHFEKQQLKLAHTSNDRRQTETRDRQADRETVRYIAAAVKQCISLSLFPVKVELSCFNCLQARTTRERQGGG